MKWLVDGCYGDGNVGDEALLQAVLGLIRENDNLAEIKVFSSNPIETRRIHDVEAIEQCNPFGLHLYGGIRHGLLLRAYRAINWCDRFVLGGGELFRDDAGWKACAGITYRLMLARWFGRRVIALGVGVQLNRPGSLASWIIRHAMRSTDAACLRDPSSLNTFREHSRHSAFSVAIPDIVFSLAADRKNDACSSVTTIGVALKGHAIKRASPNVQSQFLENLGWALNDVASSTGCRVVVIPFCPSDIEPSKALARGLIGIEHYVDQSISQGSIQPAISMAQSVDLMLSMPLHACILAMAGGIPTIGLSYDAKVSRLFAQIGNTHQCVEWKTVSKERMRDVLIDAFDNFVRLRAETVVTAQRNRTLVRQSIRGVLGANNA